MNKIFYTIIAILGFTFSSFAQTGEIQGKVVDDKGTAVPFAQVVIVDDVAGTKLSGKGAKADINGRYTIKGLSPGKYNVMARAIGKPKTVETDVQVIAGRPTTLDFKLEETENVIAKDKVTVVGKRVNKTKLIDVFTPKENTMTSAEVKENSVRDVNSLAASTGQVAQEDRGADLNIGGGRSDGNTYIIDGVKVNGGSSAVPPSAIAQLEVITSGVPAKYGDATGGVINIITKGPSKELHGSIEGITSQFLDPFGYNLIGGNLSGPLIRRKIAFDSLNPVIVGGEKQKGNVLLGFFLSGEFQHDKDRYPTIQGSYKVNDNVLQDLIANPYKLDNNGNILNRQELITAKDIEHINTHQNTAGTQVRLNGKLDWKLKEDGGNITLGGRFVYDKYNEFIQRYSLLNYENNYTHVKQTSSGYLRLYQPLFNSEKQVGKVIKNTTMQLQLDFQREGEDFYSPSNGFDLWSNGYVGKFEEILTPNVTQIGDGSASTQVKYGANANEFVDFVQFYQVNSFTASGVNYTPGTVNPQVAGLTQKFIDLVKGTSKASSISALSNAGALVNGSRASVTLHSLFYPYGRVAPSVQKENNNQIRATGNFNFDIIPKTKSTSGDLNKHTIEAGFEIEQRFNNQYNIQPGQLWQLANTSANSHLSVNTAQNYNPLLIMKDGSVRMRLQDYVKQKDSVGGIKFSLFDTVMYDKEISDGTMTTFAKNLRTSLGKSETERINVHGLDPSQLDIKMFSPDELITSDFSPTYYGYNVYGEQGPMNTSFNSFFKDKDANGNYTRAVAPLKPFYAAGYIQDRFQLKDIAFNVGVRLDYYNANQNVFIDPYAPQGVRTVGDISSNLGVVPSNISKTAAVYVDNIESPTKITGFREGSKWYDARGKELASPTYIISESGGQIKPYLVGDSKVEKEKRDIGSANFDPDLVFTNSNAIINFMPRLNFSFKIDSNALFFAHFDIMAQRPSQDIAFATALNYYNLMVRNTGQRLGNPNLKSPKTTDLELGFKQKLSNKSSLTLNFFYREYIDQIQVSKIIGGYPLEYITYANTDFSTVKGMGLAYELRRMASNIRLKANYTMQFAEGTGSSNTSQLNILNANQGNIKVIAPLNFDVRHTINVNFDYRFASGDNYDGPKSAQKYLENFGVNLQASLKSGLPYTQQSNITGVALISGADRAVTLGDVNSGGMGWRYNFNLKFDKDFKFRVGKNKGKVASEDTRKEVDLNVYLNIQNLFNTQNVLQVYRYTGSAETDGYLTSPNAALDFASKEAIATGYGQSFRDLYKIALDMPLMSSKISNYSQPRVIWLGAILSF